MGGFAFEFVSAESRDDLVELLAAYRVVPVRPASEAEAGRAPCVFRDRAGDGSTVFREKARANAAKRLGIASATDCDRVRTEIQTHPRWGTET